MKLALGIYMFLTASIASADIIKCSFTEPFYSLEYSMTKSTLTRIEPDFNSSSGKLKKTVIKNVSFQIMGPGKFELWDSKKNALIFLDLNYNGSDGMSDFIFPYEASYPKYSNFANGGIGGCTSNFQRASLSFSK